MKAVSRRRFQKGYTFIEIMVTIAILGIVVAIAIPSFLRSRKRGHMNTCIANLRQIYSAKTQASFVTTAFSEPTVLFGASAYIKVTPVCPMSKATYSVNNADELPSCPNFAFDTEYPHVMPAENY